MIQRIQSIYLLLACVLMIATLFSPLLTVNISGVDYRFDSFGIFSKQVVFFTWGVVSVAGICAILSLVNIFLYKKRKTQIKLATITSFCILFFYITVGVYYYSFTTNYEVIFSCIQYGMFLPLIAFILNLLAVGRIKKDDKLVRSLDRIR